MTTSTKPAPSSNAAPFILQPDTELSAAIAAAQGGRVDVGILHAWLLERPQPMESAAVVFASGLFQPPELTAVVTAWGKAAADAAAAAARQSSAGKLDCKVSKRGAVSLYGVNRQRPVTLYAGQWQRVLAYVGAKPDNPIAALIGSKPAAVFELAAFKEKADQAYLAEIRAGKHPHAKVITRPDGSEAVRVTLAYKSETASEAAE